MSLLERLSAELKEALAAYGITVGSEAYSLRRALLEAELEAKIQPALWQAWNGRHGPGDVAHVVDVDELRGKLHLARELFRKAQIAERINAVIDELAARTREPRIRLVAFEHWALPDLEGRLEELELELLEVECRDG